MSARPSRGRTAAAMRATRILKARATAAPCPLPEALDDGGVGHAAAFAHGLQAPAAAGALELVEQGGHELGPRAAERMTRGDGSAVDVDLAHVGVVLLLPGQHHRGEGLVDLDQVDVA